MSRTLYLHHYLPAYIMSAMLAGCVLDYYLRRLKASGQRLIAYIALGACALILAWTYVQLPKRRCREPAQVDPLLGLECLSLMMSTVHELCLVRCKNNFFSRKNFNWSLE
jgi:hypothetical protein